MFFSFVLMMFGGMIFLFDLYSQVLMVFLVLLMSIYYFSYILEFECLMNFLYVDLLSMTLILLSVWIVLLMWISDLDEKSIYKNLLSYLLLISLVFCFMVKGLVEMYIFFEFSLIPLLLLLVYGGFSPERLMASMYMFLYTMAGSLPFLIMMLLMKYNEDNLNIFLENLNYLKSWDVKYQLMFFMFLVKMPIYGLHLWLPKAHVEAPVTGSMILAGLMLKLGGYGLYRLLSFFSLKSLESFKIVVLSVSLIGGIYIGLMCLRQVDMKMMIAYSSVCHMAMVLGGVFSFFSLGAYGVLLMMLSHGLCSSGLFYIANVVYNRFKTRSLVLLKGVSFMFMNLVTLWFILLVFNLGAPPSMNFFSELFLMYSMLHISFTLIFSLVILSFISGAYSLYLYMQLSHGNFWDLNVYSMENFKELLIIISHMWPLVIYLLNVNLFLEWF